MAEPIEPFQKLIERIYSGVAHEPVEVKATPVGVRRWTFNVYVDDRDMGLCIGRKGEFMNAMRNLFRAIAIANGFVHFAVWLQSKNEDDPTLRWPTAKKGWDENKAIDLATDIIAAFKHEVMHISHQTNRWGHVELNVGPPIPHPLNDIVHVVLEYYGKSYGKVFGIA